METNGMILGEAQADTKTYVKDGTDEGFMADVIEASKSGPVLVDFWAPWCGPCKTLTPMLERAVNAKKGAVTLVKINTDEHPGFAEQLQVQSIPTVYAFKDGKPVNRFAGAIPESQIKTFIDKLTGDGDGGIGALQALAAESMRLNDLGGAAQAYAEILETEPENVKALCGMARVYLMGGEADQARQIVGMIPPEAKDPELDGIRAALAFQAEAPGDIDTLENAWRAAQDKGSSGDQQPALDYAKGLSGHGEFDEAVDVLLASIRADREWNAGAARALLLQVFDAAGQGSDVTRSGRKRLSSILFS
jgi:putative thioredoxin